MRHIEYHTFLMGILYIALAIDLSLQSPIVIQPFSILLAILIVIKGFYNFIVYSIHAVDYEHLNFKWPILFIVTGISNVFLGMVLLFNFEASNFILSIIISSWIVGDTIPYIFFTEYADKKNKSPLLIRRSTYIISLLCGIALNVSEYSDRLLSPIYYLIIYMLTFGFAFMYENYNSIKNALT